MKNANRNERYESTSSSYNHSNDRDRRDRDSRNDGTHYKYSRERDNYDAPRHSNDASRHNNDNQNINNNNNNNNSSRDNRDYHRNNFDHKRRNRSRSRERKDDRNTFETKATIESEPSKTVMIKGLPTHTTEPMLYSIIAPYYPQELRVITQRDGGECKGYAFVEFPTIEYAQYFISTFAGSTGDRNAAQLIIENRAVLLEYARDKEKVPEHSSHTNNATRGGGEPRKIFKSDWLCDACTCHNFAKRDICFRCNSPRTENCTIVTSSSADNISTSNGFSDSLVASEIPGTFLVVRGFSPLVTEEQLTEVFRQFALVKGVVLIRDPATNYSRGLAYIEFHSIEHATYALQNTNNMSLGTGDISMNGTSATLKVAFSRESTMKQLIQKSMQPGNVLAVNPMVTAALQAAQWSANNSYGNSIVNTSSTSTTSTNNNSIVPTSSFTKVKSRWPPNFDTHGGSYVFQSKTGCFLEPTTDFYYDPKSKLYYSGYDGTYYYYDNNNSSNMNTENPFVLYQPLPPSDPYVEYTPQYPSTFPIDPYHSSNNINLNTTHTTGTSEYGNINIDSNKTTNNPTNNISSVPFLKKISVGFGLLGNKSKGKKIIKDIAKWGAVQQDNELVDDDVEEDKKIKKNHNNNSNTSAYIPTTLSSINDSTKTIIDNPLDPLNVFGKRERSKSELDTMKPDINISNTTAIGSTVVATSPIIPICLLCQRQFASMEMLHRHEKESKLHAENLLKLSK